MTIKSLDEKQVFEKVMSQENPYFEDYYAFYSSWFGGIVKNPRMMFLPIDDHMVHRGDGVFEAMKAVNRSVYLMDEHLQRLFSSAEKIALKPSVGLNDIKNTILETLRFANRDDAIIRIYISRGPGNFSVNPYDSIQSQLYVVIARLKSPAPKKYQQGVTIGKSNVPIKSSWMAQVKSCNYLPNVLMKKEAIDRQLDFVIATDVEGYITECATENIMIVDKNGIITHPSLDYILKGTTMVRACELARENGMKTEARSISMDDLLGAREVIITGTSLNVLPVVKFEDHLIGNGKPGDVAKKLNQFILRDIESGNRSTPF